MAFDRDAYEVLQVSPRAHQLVIHAAFRVLAAIYHPDRDGSSVATHRMAEINIAYAKVRTPDLREGYDRARRLHAKPDPALVTPYRGGFRPPSGDEGGRTLDFGRFAGWTIAQVAQQDPDYLRWLSRHTSGARFRSDIEAAMRSIGQSDRPRQP